MKRIISFFALIAIWAYNVHGFEVNGLRYEINSDGTSVTVYGTGNSGAVVIPESVEDSSGTSYSVTSIGGGAFSGCGGLTSIEIPNSVTSIGWNAFNGCTGLTSVNIPNSVTSIGSFAFFDCFSLTSVTIGNSVTSIGGQAFEYCNGLTKVEISDIAAWCGITFNLYSNPLHYAHHLYLNGKELKDLVIPNSVTKIGNFAFDGCTGLTSVNIPNSVTSIGYRAFEGCSGLTSVTIPNHVTSIGDRAFYGCSGLTSIVVESGNPKYDSRDNCNAIIESSSNTLINGCKSTQIPNSVTSIGSNAFYECSGLTSIEIPNSVTSIGSSAFYGCSGLTSVTISNSVTEIAGNAFDSTPWYNNQPDGLLYINNVAYKYKGTMPSGTPVSIKEGTVSISSSCFSGCSGLTSIEIPNSVTSIGSSAFYGCSGLTTATIGNSVNSIGSGAFYFCFGLTSVTIPNSVKEIGVKAFYGCGGLTSVTIPNSVTTIGDSAFNGCSGLTSVNWNAKECNNYDWESSPFGRLTKIKAFTFGNDVERIPAYLCCRLSGLTSVTIGNSVTSIGDYAFSGCSGLTTLIWNAKNCASMGGMPTGGITSATIGNEVEILPDYFLSGSKITEITIPNSVTSIGWYAFQNCSGLTSVTISNSVTEIVGNAFDGTPWYNNQPDGLIYVGKVAYKYKGTMPSGTSVSIKEGTVSISGKCFENCSGLTSIEIPNSVASIGGQAFRDCSGLTSIEIPNSVTSIGDYAFFRCSNLSSLTIPNSVTSIGEGAFSGCSGLTSIVVESGNSKYDSRDNCNAIVETSTNALIAGCKTTQIPNSVASIGTYSFGFCSGLTSVTIPNSVTSIGDLAFNGCSGLSRIDSYPDPDNVLLGMGVFGFVPKDKCTLHVGTELYEAYSTAEQWKEFLNIVADLNGVEGVEVDAAKKDVEGYYNLQGIRLNEPARGQVNIIRYTDGTAKKVVVK